MAEDRPLPYRSRRLLGSLLAVVTLGVASLSMAPAASAQEAAVEAAVDDVVDGLEGRYEVLPLRDGYALRPLNEDDFALLDVGPEGVAVDGEPVDADELRDLLGAAEAELVLALQRRLGDDGGTDDGDAEREPPVDDRHQAELERDLARQAEQRAEEIARARRESQEALEELHEIDARRRVVKNDSRVSFGSSLTIEENESAREVVVMLGSLEVRGEVRGDVLVVGGPIDVDGEVGGDVVAIGGAVSLGRRARVDGEVVSIGSSVYRDPEARVDGEITEVAVGPAFDGAWSWAPWVWGPAAWSGWNIGGFITPWTEGFRRVGNLVVLAGLVLLALSLARRRTERVASRVDVEPWKAALAGLLTQVLALPLLFLVTLLLIVSIVGLPLAVILLPVSLVLAAVALLVGYAGVSLVTGRLLQGRFGRSDLSPYLAAVLGVLAIQGITLVGSSIGWMGGPVKLLAFLLLVVGFVVKYAAWTTGLGAVVLEATSGRRAPGVAALPVPPPPPYVPPSPPVEEPPPPAPPVEEPPSRDEPRKDPPPPVEEPPPPERS